MKKYLVLGALFSVAFAGTAFAKHATTAAGDVANGLLSSRHNLSTSGSHVISWNGRGSRHQAAGTSEMCVYCHTPHFTNKGSGPLWNRSSSSGAVTAYGTTIAGNNDGASNMFSTLACLTCHDGVTTFDSLINRPGKGTGKGGVATTWDFFEAGTDVSDFLTSDRLTIGNLGIIAGGGPAGGANLTDDHPIGVVYRGADHVDKSASLRARGTTIAQINLDIRMEDGSTTGVLVPGNLWAVKGFISDTATISDLLRSGNGTGAMDYVQCSSCHDLHYQNQTNPEKDFYETYSETNHTGGSIDGLFLRRVGGNSDSGLCRTCHDK